MPKKAQTKKTTKKPVARSVKKHAYTTKTAAKKSVKKKTSRPVRARNNVCACKQCCEPHESFWVNEGPVIASVEELKNAFKHMSAAQYEYHTKRDGNDFARWIRDCLHDDKRAVRIEKAKTKTGAARALQATCCK